MAPTINIKNQNFIFHNDKMNRQPTSQQIQELLRDFIILGDGDDVKNTLNYIERNSLFIILNAPLPASAETNDVEETPLTLAVNRDRQDIVDILLAKPLIDANQPNSEGQTPLEIANTRPRPRTEANRTIREHIIGTLLKSYINEWNSNAITNLLQNNTDFDINAPLFRSNGNTPLILAIILYDRNNVNSENAIEEEDVTEEDAIEENVTEEDAIEEEDVTEEDAIEEEDVLLSLLSRPGINVNTPRQEDGNTPLMYAIMLGNDSKMVETLLCQPDMDINLTNQLGETALDIARSRRDTALDIARSREYQSIIDRIQVSQDSQSQVSQQLSSVVTGIEEEAKRIG